MQPPKPTIHALLIGVNEYKRDPGEDAPRDLHGCLNDVKNMEVLLSKFSKKRNIHTKTLLNQYASYTAVIQAFKTHLHQIKPGDTALFYYSGHGTREKQTPDEFLRFFSTHYTENLVCYDGCTQNGLTLADKELAVLISQIPEGVHVVVILDSCHSGSGSREGSSVGNERMTDPFNKSRSLDQYLNGWFSEQLRNSEKIVLPHREHILLAAADRRQKARERNLEGETQGIFSYFLRKALESNLAKDSYHHILAHVKGLLRVNNVPQLPQLEPLGGASVYDRFLLGGYSGDAQFSRVFYKKRTYPAKGSWHIELGAIHGLTSQEVKSTHIPIFSDTENRTLVGHASIHTLGLQESQLSLQSGTKLNTNTYYWSWMSRHLLHVYISESDEDQLRLELNEIYEHSNMIVLCHDHESSRPYTLRKEGEYWAIYEKGQLLCGAKGEKAAIFIYDQLLTIAKHENLLTLNSPSLSNLDADNLELQIKSDSKLFKASDKEGVDYACSVEATTSGFTKIPFKAVASHSFNKEVYFALYSLDANFSINALNIDQDPRQQGHETELYGYHLRSIHNAPKSIYSDFILLASFEPILAGTLEQSGIPMEALWNRIDLDKPAKRGDRGLRLHRARRGQDSNDPAVNWVLKRVRVEIVKG